MSSYLSSTKFRKMAFRLKNSNLFMDRGEMLLVGFYMGCKVFLLLNDIVQDTFHLLHTLDL